MKNQLEYVPFMNQNPPIGLIVMSVVRKTLNLEPIAFAEDLIETGQLDSMALVQLMVALEEEFDIRIEPEELDFEDFRSVKSMTEMISRFSLLTPITIRVGR